MNRREFITLAGGVAIGGPIATQAQQAAKVARLGYLAPARLPNLIEALQAGLRDFGYVEGQNGAKRTLLTSVPRRSQAHL
jgi:putative tryptophan/tyrosine transport system substrate-binding protein